MTDIRYGIATHAGRVRERNEDCYLAESDLGLWVVADGMGGHQGGEVASQILVDFVRDGVAKGVPRAEVVAQAHDVVRLAAEQGMGAYGMGATVVALKLDGADYELAWVGDSRAYLWDCGALQQLTHDHSVVQQLVDAGQLNAEEARTHPYRNCVTQAIGAADLDHVSVDSVRGTLQQGQQLMLCTDGLTGEVSDPQIREALAAGGEEQATVEELIRLALDHGGGDNVTVLLVSAPDDAPGRASDDNTTPLDMAGLARALPDD
jgi:serine/threonine protein phosphatase PrpC